MNLVSVVFRDDQVKASVPTPLVIGFRWPLMELMITGTGPTCPSRKRARIATACSYTSARHLGDAKVDEASVEPSQILG